MLNIKDLQELKGKKLSDAVDYLKSNFKGKTESPLPQIVYFIFENNKSIDHVGLYSMKGVVTSLGFCGCDTTLVKKLYNQSDKIN